MKKNAYCFTTAFLCGYVSFLHADIIWRDTDFSTPKGQTSILSNTVQINNTDTVKFEGRLINNIGLLSLEQGSILIAEGAVELKNTGTNGDALLILGGSTATFKGDLVAENTNATNAYYSIGLANANTKLEVNGKTSVNGTRGISVNSGSFAIFNGHVEVNAAVNGIYADNATVELKDTTIQMTGINAYGLATTNTSKTNVDGPLSIRLEVGDKNAWSYAIYNDTQGITTLKDTSIVFNNTTKSGGEVGIYADNAEVSIDGNLTILNSDATNSKNYAIYANNSGSIHSSNSITHINGNLYARNNGLIRLDMAEGSSWTGSSKILSGGTININMKSTDWTMTNNSTLTGLEANNSNIYFSSGPTRFFTLTTEQLNGFNNHYYMNTDLGSINTDPNSNGERIGTAGIHGDLLLVSNINTSTNNTITVTNRGASATEGNEVLQIISTPANSTGDFRLSEAVEAGGYEYHLRQSNDATNSPNGWELYGTGKVSTTAKTAVNSYFNVAYLLTHIDTQTLLQRMGELREDNGENEGNFWIRAYGGKLNSFAGQKLDGFDMTYSGTQLGIDKRVSLSNGELYAGLMASYTKADPDYKAGSGTAKSFSSGAYATYIDHSGIYMDGIVKYTNVRNKFLVKDTQHNTIQGHTKSHGYGLSLETGKQFKLGESNFYLEPQLQIAYQYQNSDNASASNGLNIKLGDYHSLLGRTSGIIGYKVAKTNNLQLNIYAKTGIVHEFAGKTHYRLNNSKEKYSFEGSWFDNSVGMNAKFNNRHNLYGELGYATGNRFNKMQANIGYRYQF